jgi:hypothetical protein
MTTVINALVSAIALLVSAAFPSQQEHRFFSVTIGTQHEVVKSGEDFHLLITITNTSDREIKFAEVPGDPPAAEFQSSIEVRDNKGRSATETEYARSLKKNPRPRGSRVTWVLRPGESLEEDAALTRLFDLRRPGTYTISAYRKTPEHLGMGTVKSNTISIVVTP